MLGEIKLGLARDEIRLVGTATTDEYRRYVEADPALGRRFTAVEIEEPDEESSFLLLRGVAAARSASTTASPYEDEAVAASVTWSIRYLPGRALPDKALSILDLAGARAQRKVGPGPRDVGVPDVAAVVAEIADVPVERLLETDRERLLGLEKVLAERVVGHGAALARIARVIRRNAAGLRARRPIGSFLLLGPTGVGKTETAKALAEALFHSPDAMTRLDFSEYAEAHAVARLIGAPPGYIGHEAGGQLTEAVRRRPYQVILLDEIEKAHRDVLEAFLQVFDEGRLTDGRGRRVDFTNAVIVMTSNLGAAEIAAARETRSVGFSRGAAGAGAAPERLAETMIAAARAHLPPELYNRIDEVLCFGPLARAEVAEIARRLLDGLAATLESPGHPPGGRARRRRGPPRRRRLRRLPRRPPHEAHPLPPRGEPARRPDPARRPRRGRHRPGGDRGRGDRGGRDLVPQRRRRLTVGEEIGEVEGAATWRIERRMPRPLVQDRIGITVRPMGPATNGAGGDDACDT